MTDEDFKSRDEKLAEMFKEFFIQQEARMKRELEEYRKKDMIFTVSIMAFFVIVLAILHMIGIL